MKYKTEIGESMEQPSKKLKKTLLIVGITGVVYVSFKYLLPLVIPFLIAYMIALTLQPSAVWAATKMRVKIKDKFYGIPVGLIGALELVLILVWISYIFYLIGKKLFVEAELLLDQLPLWIDQLDVWLTGLCHNMESVFRLEADFLVAALQDILRDSLENSKQWVMSFLVGNSMLVFQTLLKFIIVLLIVLVAVMMTMEEMDSLKKRRERSIYWEEFAMLSKRLANVGNAYLRAQTGIMILTMIICTFGLFLIKSPYYLLFGVTLGFLDALPIFGTGTVLFPWAIAVIVQGDWLKGVVLLALYIICYFLRQIMEAKMMGQQIGLTPLETLLAMYIGLRLFGLLGFVLGPIGLLIIQDMVKHFMEQ